MRKFKVYPTSSRVSTLNCFAAKTMTMHAILLLLLAAYNAEANETNDCQKEVSMSCLNIAVDMITKVKKNFPTCGKDSKRETMDCADLFLKGNRKSGVYEISPMSRVTEGKSFNVYCDMETDGGGWTVIQRRGDYQRPKDYFYKDWKSYKEGFGDIEKDFWLGNDNIFSLTNQKLSSARFDLQDVELNRRYAQYDTFWIEDESHKYTLHFSDYSGDAGDSMVKEHNNQKFSAKDQDNDNQKEQHCSQVYKGGWWYDACHQANLNGLYLKGKHDSFADGVIWFTWKGYHESLLTTEIKVRPKNFRQSLSSLSSSSLSSSSSVSSTLTPM